MNLDQIKILLREVAEKREYWTADTSPQYIGTLWDAVKLFFSQEDDVYSRQSMLMYLKNKGFKTTSSMDTYKNYLHKAGYLRPIGRGLYKREKDIPCDLSISDVKSEAYGMYDMDGERVSYENVIRNHKAFKFIDIVKPKIKKAKKRKEKGFFTEKDFQI